MFVDTLNNRGTSEQREDGKEQVVCDLAPPRELAVKIEKFLLGRNAKSIELGTDHIAVRAKVQHFGHRHVCVSQRSHHAEFAINGVGRGQARRQRGS